MDEQIFGWFGGDSPIPLQKGKTCTWCLFPHKLISFQEKNAWIETCIVGTAILKCHKKKAVFCKKKNYHLMKSVYLWWALFEHWEIDLSIFFAGSGIFLINGNKSKALVFITHKTKILSRLEKENLIICYILKLLSTSCKDGELEQVTIFHIKNIML